MSTVKVVHWNPRAKSPYRALRALRIRQRVRNFGDLLGPLVVSKLLRQRGITPNSAQAPARLISVGSIIHMANAGDVVWGTGLNGKPGHQFVNSTNLDVRAVRGPHTAAFLRDAGVDVPNVMGDPGLLIGQLWPKGSLRRPHFNRRVCIVPNLNDAPKYDLKDPRILLPTMPLWRCLRTIASSDLVVGSSLHASVVAESFGIPARAIGSDVEPPLKYEDYYRGSYRDGYTPAQTVDEAIERGGEPLPRLDAVNALLSTFPYDLWVNPNTGD